MANNPEDIQFSPPHTSPSAPNPDYLPSSQEARDGVFKKFERDMAAYSELMSRYSIGHSERVQQALQRRAARRPYRTR